METHPYSDLNGFKNQLNLTDDEIINYGFKPGGIWFNNTESIICGTFPPKKNTLIEKVIFIIPAIKISYGNTLMRFSTQICFQILKMINHVF